MAADLSKAVGFEQDTEPISWLTRDVLLYAASIGATASDLNYIYELSPNFVPFPTYPLVASFKGDSQDVVNFAEWSNRGKPVPGLPFLNPEKLVHAEQSLEILRDIPKEAKDWKMKRIFSGAHTKGKNLITETTSVLVDNNGQEVARMISSTYHFGANVEQFSNSVSPKPPFKGSSKPPERNPDFTVEFKTSLEQAVFYRLSGDYNPLHIDPSIGEALSFGGVILHGLCSFGIGSMALLKSLGPNYKLRFISGKFTSPVLPGQTLQTLIWKREETADGGIVLDFVQVVKETGKMSLGGGVAYFIKADVTSKL